MRGKVNVARRTSSASSTSGGGSELSGVGREDSGDASGVVLLSALPKGGAAGLAMAHGVGGGGSHRTLSRQTSPIPDYCSGDIGSAMPTDDVRHGYVSKTLPHSAKFSLHHHSYDEEEASSYQGYGDYETLPAPVTNGGVKMREKTSKMKNLKLKLRRKSSGDITMPSLGSPGSQPLGEDLGEPPPLAHRSPSPEKEAKKKRSLFASKTLSRSMENLFKKKKLTSRGSIEISGPISPEIAVIPCYDENNKPDRLRRATLSTTADNQPQLQRSRSLDNLDDPEDMSITSGYNGGGCSSTTYTTSVFGLPVAAEQSRRRQTGIITNGSIPRPQGAPPPVPTKSPATRRLRSRSLDLSRKQQQMILTAISIDDSALSAADHIDDDDSAFTDDLNAYGASSRYRTVNNLHDVSISTINSGSDYASSQNTVGSPQSNSHNNGNNTSGAEYAYNSDYSDYSDYSIYNSSSVYSHDSASTINSDRNGNNRQGVYDHTYGNVATIFPSSTPTLINDEGPDDDDDDDFDDDEWSDDDCTTENEDDDGGSQGGNNVVISENVYGNAVVVAAAARARMASESEQSHVESAQSTCTLTDIDCDDENLNDQSSLNISNSNGDNDNNGYNPDASGQTNSSCSSPAATTNPGGGGGIPDTTQTMTATSGISGNDVSVVVGEQVMSRGNSNRPVGHNKVGPSGGSGNNHHYNATTGGRSFAARGASEKEVLSHGQSSLQNQNALKAACSADHGFRSKSSRIHNRPIVSSKDQPLPPIPTFSPPGGGKIKKNSRSVVEKSLLQEGGSTAQKSGTGNSSTLDRHRRRTTIARPSVPPPEAPPTSGHKQKVVAHGRNYSVDESKDGISVCDDLEWALRAFDEIICDNNNDNAATGDEILPIEFESEPTADEALGIMRTDLKTAVTVLKRQEQPDISKLSTTSKPEEASPESPRSQKSTEATSSIQPHDSSPKPNTMGFKGKNILLKIQQLEESKRPTVDSSINTESWRGQKEHEPCPKADKVTDVQPSEPTRPGVGCGLKTRTEVVGSGGKIISVETATQSVGMLVQSIQKQLKPNRQGGAKERDYQQGQYNGGKGQTLTASPAVQTGKGETYSSGLAQSPKTAGPVNTSGKSLTANKNQDITQRVTAGVDLAESTSGIGSMSSATHPVSSYHQTCKPHQTTRVCDSTPPKTTTGYKATGDPKNTNGDLYDDIGTNPSQQLIITQQKTEENDSLQQELKGRMQKLRQIDGGSSEPAGYKQTNAHGFRKESNVKDQQEEKLMINQRGSGSPKMPAKKEPPLSVPKKPQGLMDRLTGKVRPNGNVPCKAANDTHVPASNTPTTVLKPAIKTKNTFNNKTPPKVSVGTKGMIMTDRYGPDDNGMNWHNNPAAPATVSPTNHSIRNDDHHQSRLPETSSPGCKVLEEELATTLEACHSQEVEDQEEDELSSPPLPLSPPPAWPVRSGPLEETEYDEDTQGDIIGASSRGIVGHTSTDNAGGAHCVEDYKSSLKDKKLSDSSHVVTVGDITHHSTATAEPEVTFKSPVLPAVDDLYDDLDTYSPSKDTSKSSPRRFDIGNKSNNGLISPKPTVPPKTAQTVRKFREKICSTGSDGIRSPTPSSCSERSSSPIRSWSPERPFTKSSNHSNNDNRKMASTQALCGLNASSAAYIRSNTPRGFSPRSPTKFKFNINGPVSPRSKTGDQNDSTPTIADKIDNVKSISKPSTHSYSQSQATISNENVKFNKNNLSKGISIPDKSSGKPKHTEIAMYAKVNKMASNSSLTLVGDSGALRPSQIKARVQARGNWSKTPPKLPAKPKAGLTEDLASEPGITSTSAKSPELSSDASSVNNPSRSIIKRRPSVPKKPTKMLAKLRSQSAENLLTLDPNSYVNDEGIVYSDSEDLYNDVGPEPSKMSFSIGNTTSYNMTSTIESDAPGPNLYDDLDDMLAVQDAMNNDNVSRDINSQELAHHDLLLRGSAKNQGGECDDGSTGEAVAACLTLHPNSLYEDGDAGPIGEDESELEGTTVDQGVCRGNGKRRQHLNNANSKPRPIGSKPVINGTTAKDFALSRRRNATSLSPPRHLQSNTIGDKDHANGHSTTTLELAGEAGLTISTDRITNAGEDLYEDIGSPTKPKLNGEPPNERNPSVVSSDISKKSKQSWIRKLWKSHQYDEVSIDDEEGGKPEVEPPGDKSKENLRKQFGNKLKLGKFPNLKESAVDSADEDVSSEAAPTTTIKVEGVYEELPDPEESRMRQGKGSNMEDNFSSDIKTKPPRVARIQPFRPHAYDQVAIDDVGDGTPTIMTVSEKKSPPEPPSTKHLSKLANILKQNRLNSSKSHVSKTDNSTIVETGKFDTDAQTSTALKTSVSSPCIHNQNEFFADDDDTSGDTSVTDRKLTKKFSLGGATTADDAVSLNSYTGSISSMGSNPSLHPGGGEEGDGDTGSLQDLQFGADRARARSMGAIMHDNLSSSSGSEQLSLSQQLMLARGYNSSDSLSLHSDSTTMSADSGSGISGASGGDIGQMTHDDHRKHLAKVNQKITKSLGAKQLSKFYVATIKEKTAKVKEKTSNLKNLPKYFSKSASSLQQASRKSFGDISVQMQRMLRKKQQPQLPSPDYNPSDFSDHDDGWSDTEFDNGDYEESEGPTPVINPPLPRRKLPPVPIQQQVADEEEDDEDYLVPEPTGPDRPPAHQAPGLPLAPHRNGLLSSRNNHNNYPVEPEEEQGNYEPMSPPLTDTNRRRQMPLPVPPGIKNPPPLPDHKKPNPSSPTIQPTTQNSADEIRNLRAGLRKPSTTPKPETPAKPTIAKKPGLGPKPPPKPALSGGVASRRVAGFDSTSGASSAPGAEKSGDVNARAFPSGAIKLPSLPLGFVPNLKSPETNKPTNPWLKTAQEKQEQQRPTSPSTSPAARGAPPPSLPPSRTGPPPVLPPARPQRGQHQPPAVPMSQRQQLPQPSVAVAGVATVPQHHDSDDLYSYYWFHGTMTREEVNERLQSVNQDGTYILRKSNKGGDDKPFTLSILYNGKVWNLHIRLRPDNLYALGNEKEHEKTFKNVPELVQYHSEKNLILAGSRGGETTLKECPAVRR